MDSTTLAHIARVLSLLLLCPVFGLDEGDVVALEHDALQGLPGVTLHVHLHNGTNIYFSLDDNTMHMLE